MAEEAKVVMTADGKQAIAEIAKVEAANAKLEKQQSHQVEASKRGWREEQKLLRDAQREIKATETALERFARRERELNELHKAGGISVEQLNRSLGKERDILRGIGSDTKQQAGGFAAMAGFVGKFSAGLGTALAVAKVLNTELQHTVKLGEDIRKASISAAAGMETLKANFVPDATVPADKLDSAVEGISSATGLKKEVAAAALAQALSAKGDATNAETVQAVTNAGLMVKDPAAVAGFGGSMLDFLKFQVSGDTAAIGGWLQQVMAASHVSSIDKVGKNLAPVVGAGMARGMTAEGAAELFATVTQLGLDSEGDKSKTAALNLLDRLDRFEGLEGTPLERIAKLQGDAALRKEFFDKSSFGAEEKTIVEGLLSGSARSKSAFAAAVDTIPALSVATDAANRAAFFDKAAFVQGLDTAPGLIRQADMRQDVIIQQGEEAKAATAGAIAQIRDMMNRALDKSNLVGLDEFNIPLVGDVSVKSLSKSRFDREVALRPDIEVARQQAIFNLESQRDNRSLLGTVSAEDRKVLQGTIDAINDLARKTVWLGEEQKQRDMDAARQRDRNRPAPADPVTLNNAPRR